MSQRKQQERPTGKDRVESLEADLQMAFEGRELSISVLSLLNERTLEMGVLGNILDMIQQFTGLASVGMRLRQGDDYPYRFAAGITEEFLEPEHSLCTFDDCGEVTTDAEGKPLLECMCGLVMSGSTDPVRDYFSQGGSFWTNSLSKLVDSGNGTGLAPAVSEQFIFHGYESVALVPLRSGSEIIGLLQLNDPRENCFSQEMVRFLEAIGGIVGLVFTRLQVEDEIRHARDNLEERVEERTAELLAAKLSLEEEIRQREIIDQELLMSQQRLKLAMDAANLGAWDWNLVSDEVYFDHRWSAIFGHAFEKGRSDSKTWKSLIHTDDRPAILRTIERHLQGRSPYFEAEYRLKSGSGEWKWILDRGSVVQRDDEGNPVRMAGICFDITERKQMEEQLHHTAELFRGIFEGARDSIFVKNSLLHYTHVNPAFATMTGLPESDLVGKTDGELYGRVSAEALQEVDRRVLMGQSVEQEHTRVIKKIPRTFLDTKVPLRDPEGQIIGIVGISREITDRKLTPALPPMAEAESTSAEMSATLREARLAAETDSTVLLMGESGAGKDHIARYIHNQSKRANGPFFSINCAAVAQDLAESELFGYESGAFTGSKGPKRGLLELAEGGTILLNEIGDLSLQLQAKLLTFLDTRQFTRVGGVKLLTVNARLIAATNRNLEMEVQLNRFRQDLFYRLDVFTIQVPPLRKRSGDIRGLAPKIVAELAPRAGLDSLPDIDPAAMEALESYSWPGNVRELRNVLERALILCNRRQIRIEDLAIHSSPRPLEVEKTWAITVGFPEDQTINDVTMNVKRLLVVEALRRSGGSRKRAADLLGISPDSLKHYIQIFHLASVVPLRSRLTG
jgi:PAS domain S-box-containing protein